MYALLGILLAVASLCEAAQMATTSSQSVTTTLATIPTATTNVNLWPEDTAPLNGMNLGVNRLARSKLIQWTGSTW